MLSRLAPCVLALALLGAAPPPEVVPLVPGVPVERELAAGESHRYSVAVPAGHFLQVTVEQRGVDVELRLLAGGGREVARRDGPYGAHSTDRLSEVVDFSGMLTLEVVHHGGSGEETGYSVSLAEPRPATADDRALARAEALFFQALVRRFSEKDPEGALKLWDQSIPLWQQAGDSRGEAEAWYWSAGAAKALGQLESATERFEKSLSEWSRDREPERRAEVLYQIGFGLYQQQEFLEASRAFEEALEVYREIGDLEAQAQTLTNLGSIHSILGRYRSTLQHLEQAQTIWQQLGTDHPDLTATLNNLANAYARLGDLATSLQLYQRVLERNREEDNDERTARTLHNLAWAYEVSGWSEQALEHASQALVMAQELAIEDLEATSLTTLGHIHRKQRRFQQAEPLLLRALRLRKSLQDHVGEAVVLQEIGKLYADRGDTPAAARLLSRSLDLARETGHAGIEARGILFIGFLESAEGKHAEAVRRASEALEIVEALRADILRQDLQMTMLSAWHWYYRHAVEIAMAAHRAAPGRGFDAAALAFAERARARSLSESLIEGHEERLVTADTGLGQEEARLRQRIVRLERQKLDASADAEKEGIEAELQAAILELRKQRGLLREHLRQTRTLFYPPPIGLAQIQRELLDPGTVLLQYFLAPQKSYLWVVTDRALKSIALPPQFDLERMVRRAHDLLATGQASQHSPEWRALAMQLSKALLPPLDKYHRHKRLLLVLDGPLHYLPFAALPLPGTGDLLAHRYEISNQPSASALALLRHRTELRKPASKTLAVFADPVLQSTDPRLAPETDISPNAPTSALQRNLLLRLPNATREARAIADLVPEEDRWLVLGTEASRATVLGSKLADFRILHFATHAVIDNQRPELSGLALSLYDSEGEPIPGFLQLHDLASLNLRADLVVLSACETALGRELRGEGLLGLTHGFFQAGAGAVVSSLWPVDDRATAKLMSHFYNALLGKRMPPAAALRGAQLRLLEEEPNLPISDWAAFVIHGGR